MQLRKTLLAATALAALPVLADAQPVTGLYIGGGAGVNWVNKPSDVDISGPGFGLGGVAPGTTISNVGKVTFNTGWTGLASIGWGFGNGLRAEVEGNYRSNEVDTIRGFNLAPVARTGGFQQTYGVMANVFYDFDPGFLGFGPSYVQPYIGVGVGYGWTNWHRVRGVSVNTPTNGITVDADDTGGAFAYQAILGVAMPMTWAGVPGLSFTAEGRFYGTLRPDIGATIRAPSGAVLGATTLQPQNMNYSVLLGLRYAFYQPPPPAPPPVAAPAPAPARTYLVFFDWDRADLTDRARQIIAEAAENSTRVQSTRIEVAGHADRSGSAAYNQRLSQRRADNVAAELVRRGVPRNAIVVTAYGETRPLVPTADGVREPQNRRVEINM
jgi:outer membrane protein OmpA-like peptidoglycan-associated protein